MGKDFVGNGRGLILRYYADIRLEGLRKITRNLVSIAGDRGRNSNPEPPEYKARVLVREYSAYCNRGTFNSLNPISL
jgi:hypothetical protein